jgi:hypothetical protein
MGVVKVTAVWPTGNKTLSKQASVRGNESEDDGVNVRSPDNFGAYIVGDDNRRREERQSSRRVVVYCRLTSVRRRMILERP